MRVKDLNMIRTSVFSLQQLSVKDQSEEITLYLKEDQILINESPLLSWKEKQKRFPILSMIAQDLLAVPATSTPCERIFSKAGIIINTKRSLLASKSANMLLFLEHNLGALNKKI